MADVTRREGRGRSTSAPVGSADAAFIVWGPPRLGPRSTVLARELGLAPPHFIFSTTRRGWLAAPWKYAYQAATTIRILLAERPDVVFVQSPPSWAVVVVGIYATLTGAHYIIDAHSAAFQERIWSWPSWLHRAFTRRAILTIVTNEALAERVRQSGGRDFLLPDIPTRFPERPGRSSGPGLDATSGTRPDGRTTAFSVAVVNTYAPDEPLGEVLGAARELPDVTFFITGKPNASAAGFESRASANVSFTGFLPDAEYYELLAGVDAVACLTTRNDTMQRGACEALSLAQPIITSDWPLLRSYFDRGTVHVAGTAAAIRDGVRTVIADHDRLRVEIAELSALRRREWAKRRARLGRLAGLRLGANPASEDAE